MAETFTFRLASGRTISNVQVHGRGGVLDGSGAAAVVRLMIQRATRGEPLGRVYEPRPGHVRVYRRRAAGNDDEQDIDLRGAELLVTS